MLEGSGSVSLTNHNDPRMRRESVQEVGGVDRKPRSMQEKSRLQVMRILRLDSSDGVGGGEGTREGVYIKLTPREKFLNRN